VAHALLSMMGMNNLYHLAWPIDPEEDDIDRRHQQHVECGCHGASEWCECFYFCPDCDEVREAKRLA